MCVCVKEASSGKQCPFLAMRTQNHIGSIGPQHMGHPMSIELCSSECPQHMQMYPLGSSSSLSSSSSRHARRGVALPRTAGLSIAPPCSGETLSVGWLLIALYLSCEAGPSSSLRTVSGNAKKLTRHCLRALTAVREECRMPWP